MIDQLALVVAAGGIAIVWFVLPLRRGGAFWVPAQAAVVRRMLSLAKVKPGERVLDLGSGDGRIPIAAATEFGARAVGVELNFFLVAWARLRARLAKARNVTILWQDLWRTDVSRADVITLFLFDWSTPKVGEMLLSKAKEDVRVVSYIWKLGKGWRIVAEDADKGVRVYRKAYALVIMDNNRKHDG
jgi:predicted RNA methylase